MKWLSDIADRIESVHSSGELTIETGASPSGTYHFGHLRELIIADALLLELRRRGRAVTHVQFVDDLDGLRKIPVNVPKEYEKYLGQPLCDIPAPDSSSESYADFFLDGFVSSAKSLGIEMGVIRSHDKYRSGFFAPAIERTLEKAGEVKKILEQVAGRKLDQHWSPIQILEGGYLKNRQFVALDKYSKTIRYLDSEGEERSTGYTAGEVKLDWRIDWPARWWLLKVSAEPAGRDHSTKGGSFDTGMALLQQVFEADPIVTIPYDFVNRTGDTKKMSASKGTGVQATEVVDILPAEVIRYFVLRAAPSKRLYFDTGEGVVKLIDDFAALTAKVQPTADEKRLIELAYGTNNQQHTISHLPFSHLVASYQAALLDPAKTIAVLKRTESAELVAQEEDIIKRELVFIDKWLKHWAPENMIFKLLGKVDKQAFTSEQTDMLKQLADTIATAPEGADGQWFHDALYKLKETNNLEPKEIFPTLYQALIGKDSGPRAGWFLSILPRDWLIRRLRLEA